MWLIYKTNVNHTNSIMWEDAIRDELLDNQLKKNDLEYLSYSVLSSTSFDNEILVLVFATIPYLSLAFVILLTFSVLVTLRLDWIIAKVCTVVVPFCEK